MKKRGPEVATLLHYGHSARARKLPDGRFAAVVFYDQTLHRNAADGVNGQRLLGSFATEAEAFDAAKVVMEMRTALRVSAT